MFLLQQKMAPTIRTSSLGPRSGSDTLDDAHNSLELTTLLSSGSFSGSDCTTPMNGAGSPKWTSATGTSSNYEFGRVNNMSFVKDDIVPLQSSVSKYKEEMRKRRKTTARPRSQLCKYTVDRVQGILLPQKISSYIPVSKDDTNDDSLDMMNKDVAFRHPSRIPLVQGLERVTNGTQPASDVVALCGMRPPRFLWFVLSGGLCDVIQFFIDLVLFYVLHIKDTTVCWVLGYAISIMVRHTSHRYLVFGNYVGGYCSSLLRMYTGYSIILVASTLFNLILTHSIQMQHYTAWVITLIWTNIMNYFLLTQLWSWDWSKGRKAFSLGDFRKKRDDRGGNDSNNRLREVV